MKRRRRRRRSNPSTAYAANPRRRHHRRHIRRRRNPSLRATSGFGAGLSAILFGTAAALVGTVGGLALVKAGITNRWANCAGNVAMAAIAGGGLGMVNPAAGTVVAHNFALNATNWALAGIADANRPKAVAGMGDAGVAGVFQDPDQVAGVVIDDGNMGSIYDADMGDIGDLF